MRPVIVLLTDFGHLDPYVGQMKGALLREAPDAAIIDLCHEVDAHDIMQAAFWLQASHRHFPPQSIFLNVVDPGVGAERSIVLAKFENQVFLAPDNGLLSFLIDKQASWWRLDTKFFTPSNTFHGRDIFAPLAARLALGATPEAMGSPMAPDMLVRRDLDWVAWDNNVLACTVLHVDRFGNCLLNLHAENFDVRGETLTLDDGTEVAVVKTYAHLSPGQIGLLEGSQGVMELAMNQDSCARRLDLHPSKNLRLSKKDISRP